MKNCLGCGAPNEDTARFCNSCGRKFQDKTEEVQIVPVPVEKGVPVSAERIVTIIASYIAAYLFLAGTKGRYMWESLVIFALTVISVELINKDRARPAESWVWLFCFALCSVSYCFFLDDVWNDYQTAMFSIVFGVWWVLSRSGKLMEGKSGHLLPADAWSGFAVIPFKNYLLRFRTILSGVRSLRKEEKKGRSGRIWWTAAAALLCAWLFVCAAELLMEADSNFENMLGKLFDLFNFDLDSDMLANIIISIPFGCLGCGLILGCASDDRSNIDMRRERLCGRLSAIRRVPDSLWTGVICLFSVLYVTFFVLQGSYLFGAFAGKLPEGFVFAEYARQGFFELCRVMVVNSVLLWLATRMVSAEKKHEKVFMIACLVLLAESILFSIIAFSKLALYISVYGFTQLRMQSTWLVCVLLAACILWIYTLFTDRPVFRKWMFFGAVTLSILAVV